MLIRDQSGSTTTQTVNWNSATTVNQLKAGSVYSFSTDVINYRGYACSPTFYPSTVTANSTRPATNLSYRCVQTAQNRVTLNVDDAPSSLTSLKVTFTANNGAIVTSTIPLTNGAGSNTLTLPSGVVYNLSTETVNGYSIRISPQQLSPTTDTTVAITFVQTQNGTPVAVNGQLKVCGTKLCNEANNPIQLEGMSSHGL